MIPMQLNLNKKYAVVNHSSCNKNKKHGTENLKRISKLNL